MRRRQAPPGAAPPWLHGQLNSRPLPVCRRPLHCLAALEGGKQPGSSAPDPNAAASVSTFNPKPWQLMGRVLSSERVALQYDEQLNLGLVRSAAARASGLDYDEFEARLQVWGVQYLSASYSVPPLVTTAAPAPLRYVAEPAHAAASPAAATASNPAQAVGSAGG